MAIALCQCGCGLPAPIASRTIPSRASVKGQPCRFIAGHNNHLIPRGIQARLRARGIGRRQYEHRRVVEEALGKALTRSVEIHHVDGDKMNNARTNLVICQDRAYHMLLHYRARIVRAGGNPNTDKICARCRVVKPFEAFARSVRNTPSRRHHRCRECDRQARRQFRVTPKGDSQ